MAENFTTLVAIHEEKVATMIVRTGLFAKMAFSHWSRFCVFGLIGFGISR